MGCVSESFSFRVVHQREPSRTVAFVRRTSPKSYHWPGSVVFFGQSVNLFRKERERSMPYGRMYRWPVYCCDWQRGHIATFLLFAYFACAHPLDCFGLRELHLSGPHVISNLRQW